MGGIWWVPLFDLFGFVAPTSLSQATRLLLFLQSFHRCWSKAKYRLRRLILAFRLIVMFFYCRLHTLSVLTKAFISKFATQISSLVSPSLEVSAATSSRRSCDCFSLDGVCCYCYLMAQLQPWYLTLFYYHCIL